MDKELKKIADVVKAIGDVATKDEVVEEEKAGVINTAETNHGKEIVRLDEQSHTLLDLIPTFSRLLPLLPWNHGTNMAMQERLPMIGKADKFSVNTEWTSGNTSFTASATKPKTSEVTIVQGQLILEIPVSKREANYEFVNLENILRNRIAQSFAETIDSILINADSATTNNINGTFDATQHWSCQPAGIRKVGIANTAVNVGTLAATSYLDVFQVLDPGYSTDLDNLLILTASNVYYKTLPLDELITMDKFWPDATIRKGVIGKIWWVDYMTSPEFPALTTAAGVISATASDNVKGSFAVLWKPAVQYGYGQPMEIEITKVAGRGYVLTATAEFGFTIVNDDQYANVGKTVGLWVNVTVA